MNYKDALTNLDLVYPDGIEKGFPLWTENGMKMQNITTNIFLDIFSKNNKTVFNYPKQIQTLKNFSLQYKDRIDKYDSSLPIFDLQGKKSLFITDNLPYNLKKMDEENIYCMLTYYYVLRLLNSKQIPMSRDYYISPLLQFNIAIDNMSKEEAIQSMIDKMYEFCKKINLPSVILEYDGVEGYSEKVYMVGALNQKMETQTIIQCSLLSKELLDSFDLSENLKKKYVFDIGYSQKIFAYLATNNMDEYGMRVPSVFGKKDIAIVYNPNINSEIMQNLKKDKYILDAIYLDDRLGNKKLKTIKNYYKNKGVRILLVQNYKDNEEFFIKYSIREQNENIFTENQIRDIIEKEQIKLDKFYYKEMDKKLELLRKKGFAYVSEFKKKGKILK